MKCTLVTAAAIAVAAVVAFSAHGGTNAKAMKIVATQHDFGQVDAGKKGPTRGDSTVFSEALRIDGKLVGADHIVCTFMGAWPTETDFCRGLFVLPGGSLIAEGAAGPGPFTVAIVGGNGRYAGARGTIRAIPSKTGETLLVSLL